MFRSPAALMMFMSLVAVPAFADTGTPESATDATTPMDKQLGNQQPPKDNTLSDAEALRLKNQAQEGAGGQEQGPGATVTTTPATNSNTPSDQIDRENNVR